MTNFEKYKNEIFEVIEAKCTNNLIENLYKDVEGKSIYNLCEFTKDIDKTTIEKLREAVLKND